MSFHLATSNNTFQLFDLQKALKISFHGVGWNHLYYQISHSDLYLMGQWLPKAKSMTDGKNKRIKPTINRV